jgi:lipoprotein-anchoring transpeptidase ErfK/SrfK
VTRFWLSAVACAAVATAGASASAAAPRRYEVVTLLAAHAVRAAPAPTATRVRTILARRPITGGPTVLPVLGRATSEDGAQWLRVMLPGRPNGAQGWIAARHTAVGHTGWRLVVHTTTRRVLAYRSGRLVRSFMAIVGKPSTPTPHGPFFVEESVAMRPGAPGGPFALALSARSNVLQEFEGGPGQIALHGVANLGGTLGAAESHGCVRLANDSIRWLAARVPLGTRVHIVS